MEDESKLEQLDSLLKVLIWFGAGILILFVSDMLVFGSNLMSLIVG